MSYRSTDLITNCKAEDPFQQIPSIYASHLYSFGYINGKLMMISTRYKISDSPSGFSNFDPFLGVVPLEYQYITRECDDIGYSYRDYFSNDRGDDIHLPHNLILQYAEKHIKEEVIEYTLSKIPEDIMLSKAFVKNFVKKLTESQLKTFANSLRTCS